MLYTVPGHEVLKEMAWYFRNSIISAVLGSVNKQESNWDIAFYTSTNLLLTFYMEKCESQVKCTKRWAAWDMCVGIIGVTIHFYIFWKKELYLPRTGGLYPLTGGDCPDQTGHNNIEARIGQSTRFFALNSEFRAIYLLVCPSSHSYVTYKMAEKKKFTELLYL